MPETVFSEDALDSKHDVLSYATPRLARLKFCKATHTSMEWCGLAAVSYTHLTLPTIYPV